MGYSLGQFSAECHRLLTATPGPEGRRQVCALLEKVLLDEDFVATYLRDETPERQLLYEDPELGFCIFAHHYKGARASNPHDHGPYWAIYGQARGDTIMSDFTLVEPAAEGKPGKVSHVREYTLKPGMAHLYNEGDLHAPRREDTTWLIRIEGRNLEKIRRLAYRLA